MKGVFKISVDGTLVFDKAEAGHLPSPDETADLVEKRLGPRLEWRTAGRA